MKKQDLIEIQESTTFHYVLRKVKDYKTHYQITIFINGIFIGNYSLFGKNDTLEYNEKFKQLTGWDFNKLVEKIKK